MRVSGQSVAPQRMAEDNTARHGGQHRSTGPDQADRIDVDLRAARDRKREEDRGTAHRDERLRRKNTQPGQREAEAASQQRSTRPDRQNTEQVAEAEPRGSEYEAEKRRAEHQTRYEQGGAEGHGQANVRPDHPHEGPD